MRSVEDLERRIEERQRVIDVLKGIRKAPSVSTSLGSSKEYSGAYGEFLREYDAAGTDEDKIKVIAKEIRRLMYGRGYTKKSATNKVRQILERHDENIEFDLD